MSALPGALWLVGCGNMGGAMLRRWIAAGLDPARVTVIDPASPELPEGVAGTTVFPAGAPDTVVLAIKPQQIDATMAALAGAGAAPRLLISILAGVEQAAIAARLPGTGTIVRAMPNLPVAIGKGVVVLCSDSDDADARDAAAALMAPLGLVEWIAEERLFDAVTALSGCGPGFVYRFIDAMAAAGAALGLPADQAARLAVATVEGSALLAAQASEPPAVLADRVASPGGSTREGLNVLDRDGAMMRLMGATLAAAAARNAELAAAARG